MECTRAKLPLGSHGRQEQRMSLPNSVRVLLLRQANQRTEQQDTGTSLDWTRLLHAEAE